MSKFEENKFGDQKYLDDWKLRFIKVAEINEPGACVAPWNVNKFRISKTKGVVYLDKRWRLLYYHFHSFKMNFSDYKYILTGDRHNNYRLEDKTAEIIYHPYINEMKRVIKNLKKSKTFLEYSKLNPLGEYKTLDHS